MKKLLLLHLFCCFYFQGISQNASVESSICGAQIGFLGVYFQHELKITETIVLRSESGFDSGIFAAPFIIDKVGFVLFPVVTLEPRLYYNLNKRRDNSLNIEGNSGNFISLKTSYIPDWFVISNITHAAVRSNLSLIPTWGIRRAFGNNFVYEAGFGLGYRFYFEEYNSLIYKKGQLAANILLRFGYRF